MEVGKQVARSSRTRGESQSENLQLKRRIEGVIHGRELRSSRRKAKTTDSGSERSREETRKEGHDADAEEIGEIPP